MFPLLFKSNTFLGKFLHTSPAYVPITFFAVLVEKHTGLSPGGYNVPIPHDRFGIKKVYRQVEKNNTRSVRVGTMALYEKKKGWTY